MKNILDKFDAILAGSRKKHENHPHQGNHVIENLQICDLAMLLAQITSHEKYEREFAKKKIRELVKLGCEDSAPASMNSL